MDLQKRPCFGQSGQPAARSLAPPSPQIDYVRLYQDPSAINLGCSPPDMPTEQYIAW